MKNSLATQRWACAGQRGNNSKQSSKQQILDLFFLSRENSFSISPSYRDGGPSLCIARCLFFHKFSLIFPLLQSKLFTYYTWFLACPPDFQGTLSLSHVTSVPPPSHICCRHSLASSFKMISTLVFFLKCTCKVVSSLKIVHYTFW